MYTVINKIGNQVAWTYINPYPYPKTKQKINILLRSVTYVFISCYYDTFINIGQPSVVVVIVW